MHRIADADSDMSGAVFAGQPTARQSKIAEDLPGYVCGAFVAESLGQLVRIRSLIHLRPISGPKSSWLDLGDCRVGVYCNSCLIKIDLNPKALLCQSFFMAQRRRASLPEEIFEYSSALSSEMINSAAVVDVYI